MKSKVYVVMHDGKYLYMNANGYNYVEDEELSTIFITYKQACEALRKLKKFEGHTIHRANLIYEVSVMNEVKFSCTGCAFEHNPMGGCFGCHEPDTGCKLKYYVKKK